MARSRAEGAGGRAAVHLGRHDLVRGLTGNVARLGPPEAFSQDLGPGPAERAESSGGRLTASLTGGKGCRLLRALETFRDPFHEPQVEGGLRPGGASLQAIHGVLVL